MTKNSLERKFEKLWAGVGRGIGIVVAIRFLFTFFGNPFVSKEPTMSDQEKEEKINTIYNAISGENGSRNSSEAAFNMTRYFEYQKLYNLMIPVPRGWTQVREETNFREGIGGEVHTIMWMGEQGNGAYIVEIGKGLSDKMDIQGRKEVLTTLDSRITTEETRGDVLTEWHYRDVNDPNTNSLQMLVGSIAFDAVFISLGYQNEGHPNFGVEDFKYLTKKLYDETERMRTQPK